MLYNYSLKLKTMACRRIKLGYFQPKELAIQGPKLLLLLFFFYVGLMLAPHRGALLSYYIIFI